MLPVGFLQLEAAFTESYHFARSLAFYEQPLVQALFWARFPLRPVTSPEESSASIPDRKGTDD